MTAKEYLNQIREKDAAINRMIRQKENLKGMYPAFAELRDDVTQEIKAALEKDLKKVTR